MKHDFIISAPLNEEVISHGRIVHVAPESAVAGEKATLTCTFELTKDIQSGCVLQWWQHFVSDIEPAQVDDPDAPAHFSCDLPSDQAEAEAFPRSTPSHGPGIIFPHRKYAGVKVLKTISAGTRIAFNVSDVRMQTYASPAFNLRIVVQQELDVLGYIGDACWRILGGPCERFRVIAPTVVAPGEVFDCRIIAIDHFGNPSEIKNDVLSPGLIDISGNMNITREKTWKWRATGLSFQDEGIQYLSIKDASTGCRGTSNPIAVRRGAENICWGELHQHAYLLDGSGSIPGNYDYGAEIACLDFGSVTPHLEGVYQPPRLGVPAPGQNGWEELKQAAAEDYADGFVPIIGYEVGCIRSHADDMNLYYRKADDAADELHAEIIKEAPTYQKMCELLSGREGEVLFLPHAHTGGSPLQYDLEALPDIQTCVEVASVHGIFPVYYDNWLASGRKVGVIAGGDNHMHAMGNASPGNIYVHTNGLTAAVCEKRTHSDIWEALTQRNTYATSNNQRIYMDFSINQTKMGGICSPGEGKIRATVAGTDSILSIDLVKCGNVIKTVRPFQAKGNCYRLALSDNIMSRRNFVSSTTGTIQAKQSISLLRAGPFWNAVEYARESSGTIAFRTSAYSGAQRVIIFQTEAEQIDLSLQDQWMDETLLDRSVNFSPDEQSQTEELIFNMPPQNKFGTEEPSRLTLRLDKVQPDAPKTLTQEWSIPLETGDYYYLRMEQMDGSYAWSSPIWIE